MTKIRTLRHVIVSALALVFYSTSAPAEDAISYADSVISFNVGKPSPAAQWTIPQSAIGRPDYNGNTNSGFVSLGCKGELVLQFTDNSLIDGPDSDLTIVEVGAISEPIIVHVSKDGAKWIKIGKQKGGLVNFDLAGKVAANTNYPFVKIVDARKKNCKEQTAGADIDSVIALNGASTAIILQKAVIRQQAILPIRYPDKDGDGHIDGSFRDGNGRPVGDDCDDNDAGRFPGNVEVVDTAFHDEDCDLTTFGTRDNDNDGYVTAEACNYDLAGVLQCAKDCNDNNAAINPRAGEICDGIDNNCNKLVDEGLLNCPSR